jgi:hypothetical protein
MAVKPELGEEKPRLGQRRPRPAQDGPEPGPLCKGGSGEPSVLQGVLVSGPGAAPQWHFISFLNCGFSRFRPA